MLLEDRIAADLMALVPAKLARLVAMEVVIVGAVLGAPFRMGRVASGDLTFSYNETTRIRLLLVAGPLLLLFEGIVIHQLLGPDHFWWRLLHMAVCLYASVWIWGAYALMKVRPHRIDGDQLWIHRGVWGHVRIPMTNVASVRAVDAIPAKKTGEGGAVSFTVRGAEKVELTFRTPVVPMGFLTPLERTERLVVSADDPAAFCAAVARAANIFRQTIKM
jgi:hypothetical protein